MILVSRPVKPRNSQDWRVLGVLGDEGRDGSTPGTKGSQLWICVKLGFSRACETFHNTVGGVMVHSSVAKIK